MKKPKKIKDWAFSSLAGGETTPEPVDGILTEKEVDYTISILRSKSHEIMKGEFLFPIFEKARASLFLVMRELLLADKIHKVAVKYSIPSLENTFRFLFKAKVLYRARAQIVPILNLLARRGVRLGV